MWNAAEQALYWTDIPKRRIWRYDWTVQETQLVWQGEQQVGGFAFAESGDMILCTDAGVYRLAHRSIAESGRAPALLHDIRMTDDERFNDITTDPAGRIFAGTFTERREHGILYRLEKDADPVPVLRDIGTSNGMTFSLDLAHFYHTDSHVKTITRYDYDTGTGNISNPRPFYHGTPENGSPDGLTIDTDGFFWVACYRGGKVLRLNQAGQILDQLLIPAANVSSVMFGGPDLNQLFITTARQENGDEKHASGATDEDQGGRVFRASLGAQGRPEWLTAL